MNKITNVVQLSNGYAVPNASILVENVTGGLATLWQNYAGTVSQSNPVTTNATGEYSFYIADGRYNIATSGTGIVTETEFDVPVGGVDTLTTNLLDKTTTTSGGGVVKYDASLRYSKDTVAGGLIGMYIDAAAYPWLVQADGNIANATANTAAINAVLAFAASRNARGIGIIWPNGNIMVNTATGFTIPPGVLHFGTSRNGTRFIQSNLSGPIFNHSGALSGLRDMSMVYLGTPTVGANAIVVTSSNVHLNEFQIENCWDGVSFLAGSSAAKMSNFNIGLYENIGVHCNNTNDIYLSQFIIDAGNSSRGLLGGMRMAGKVEALVTQGGDILNGVYSITGDGSGFNNRPAYNKFIGTFFDGAALGSNLANCVELDFVGCWFSGGRSGGGFAGLNLINSNSVRFNNTNFFNCGAQGLVVAATSSHTHLVNCSANSNSVTAGAGAVSGVVFASGAVDFSVLGGSYTNGLYTGTQSNGIQVGSLCDRFTISGATVSGNVGVGILDNSASTAEKTIVGNPGYKTVAKGTATILSGTTSVVITHGLAATPLQYEIRLTGGSGPATSVGLFSGAIGATTFTINTATAPAANITVTWEVRIKGA